MVYKLLPTLNDKQRIKVVQAASDAFSSCGVTWAQDAWVEDDTLETWLQGAKAGVLKFRVNLAWLAEPEGVWRTKLESNLARRDRVAKEAPEWITGNTVKFFADGILEGGTAAVLEDYCDCPSKGIPNWRREELIEAVAEVVKSGFQAHIHAIGDAGIRNALDAFEYARKVHPNLINPVIAHSQLIDPADLPRFKELDVIANFEPLWAQLANEQVVLTVPRLGQERADRQYPMATLLHSGTKISFGSDWPVTSPVPMEGIGVAITRQTDEEFPPGGWVPKERLTLDEALTAYTMGSAVQASESHLWGDLSIGKRADIAVLNSDIHALEPMQVRRAKVVGTWLGGVRVFG
jgi:predicted amidohydrolase YtcJ